MPFDLHKSKNDHDSLIALLRCYPGRPRLSKPDSSNFLERTAFPADKPRLIPSDRGFFSDMRAILLIIVRLPPPLRVGEYIVPTGNGGG
jgi:hypothetical protein